MAISTNYYVCTRYFVDTTGWILLLPTITLYHRYQDQRSADGARSPKNICLFNFFKKGEILLFILGVKKEERNVIQKCLSFFPFLTLNSEMPHNIAFRMAKKEAFSNTYIQNTLNTFMIAGTTPCSTTIKVRPRKSRVSTTTITSNSRIGFGYCRQVQIAFIIQAHPSIKHTIEHCTFFHKER